MLTYKLEVQYSTNHQILAYADDIDIIGRSEKDVKRTFMALEIAANKMGLKINEQKTKYMIVGNKRQKKRLNTSKIY